MRSRVERLLRLVGVGAIVGWILNAALPEAAGPAAAPVSRLPEELPRWTGQAALREVHVRLDTVPDARALAWLAALRRAGTRVTWEGTLAPLAVETFRSASPAAPVVVLVTTTRDTAVVGDALGPLDTLGISGAASVRLASVDGGVVIQAGAQRAHAPPVEPQEPKRVYVAGAAGWEAKFVIAALEEDGWRVDARLSVAPGKDVVQGSALVAPDTAAHAAVILMDSAAAETVRGVEPFVRAGGGVVLAGDASKARRVAQLVAWRAGTRELAALGTLPGDTAWRGLSRIPLSLVASHRALAIERRGDAATVVARRHHAGRVVAVGYDATWRWRMAGGANSVREHREWWTRLLASVAARPTTAAGAAAGAAPVAAVHDALGAASGPAGPPGSGFPRDTASSVLALLALLCLVSEWLLRRTRGAR